MIVEAFEMAHREVGDLRRAEASRRQVGKPKWVDVELTAELDAAHGSAVHGAIAENGLREATGSGRGARQHGLRPEITMASTEEDMDPADAASADFASS